MAKNIHNNKRRITAQPLTFLEHSYLERTSRPIYGLIFLLPFIIFYELGTILISSELMQQSHIRVVAFVWLASFANYLGLSSRFAWLASPLLVVVILLALQITSRKPWTVRFKDFLPVGCECIILAVPLIVLSALLNRPAVAPDDAITGNSGAIKINAPAGATVSAAQTSQLFAAAQTNHASQTGPETSLLVNIVTGIGAGIYEEFIFRLVLICLLMLFFQDFLSLARNRAILLAVLISAALFSAHHHVVFLNGHFCRTGDFTWPQFIFRTIAGIYFAALFAFRGFGVTAGTHAFYDIIVALLNAVFSGQPN